ncbi:MAG: acyl carrier protein [Thermoanaerobacteraceae bacterium]|uniref:acyl carrier protein n=1 Tax=Herbinix luporum TaxID=1679721 RepID=UPI00176FD492|nr:acyl carrier protein [Herbinix luporum]NLZ52218.1 acyl carrier protein [Thermoanaerobacteraceae bacterium]NMB01229.1 acyl carrier protein [Bacillota bacterium]HHT55975.1 acyl carrier protein [Herbinix luporum]
MDRKSIEDIVIESVCITYERDKSEISCETNIKEDLGGASILMVGLVSLIENELDVLVPLPVAASAKTIGELVDKVEGILKKG